MKLPANSIETYNISGLHAMTGNSNLGNDLFVYRLSELPVKDRLNHPFRTMDFTIFLHLRGRMELKVNLINYVNNKKCLFVITPGAVREIIEESEDYDAVILGFSPDFFGKTMVQKNHSDQFGFFSSLNDPMYVITDEEAELICTLMLSLKKNYTVDNHPFFEEKVHHSFSLFMYEFASLVKKYRKDEEHRFTRQEDILQKFARLILTHFKEERSVQYYADALYITPKHLTKIVKEITGKTSGVLIDEMVITEAKILLSNFSYSVAQVADQLHFSDQFFFSKFFKKHVGVGPKEYKNLM